MCVLSDGRENENSLPVETHNKWQLSSEKLKNENDHLLLTSFGSNAARWCAYEMKTNAVNNSCIQKVRQRSKNITQSLPV